MSKSISLSCELGELAHVLEGARLLCDGINERGLGERDARQLVRTLGSTLVMVIARMRQVCRAARGELDPASLWAEHNAVTLGGPDRDVVLAPWRPADRERAAKPRKARK